MFAGARARGNMARSFLVGHPDLLRPSGHHFDERRPRLCHRVRVPDAAWGRDALCRIVCRRFPRPKVEPLPLRGHRVLLGKPARSHLRFLNRFLNRTTVENVCMLSRHLCRLSPESGDLSSAAQVCHSTFKTGADLRSDTCCCRLPCFEPAWMQLSAFNSCDRKIPASRGLSLLTETKLTDYRLFCNDIVWC